eukprot:3555867-Rhodomonas_salina.2
MAERMLGAYQFALQEYALVLSVDPQRLLDPDPLVRVKDDPARFPSLLIRVLESACLRRQFQTQTSRRNKFKQAQIALAQHFKVRKTVLASEPRHVHSCADSLGSSASEPEHST